MEVVKFNRVLTQSQITSLLLIAGALHDIQENCKDEQSKRQLAEVLTKLENILKPFVK